jgi:GTPase SAR1 family protein
VWDVPGQERFRNIAEDAYRGSRGALVAYDITRRQTWINAKGWVHDIRSVLSDHDARMVPFILGTLSRLLDSQALKRCVVLIQCSLSLSLTHTHVHTHTHTHTHSWHAKRSSFAEAGVC